MLVLRGPSKYRMKDKQFYNLNVPDIAEAYIDVSGIVFPLQENRIVLERYDTYVNVYHTFTYSDEGGKTLGGRWWDDFPLDTFRQTKALFRHEMADFEDGDGAPGTAIFRVFFTEKAAAQLRAFS